MRLMRRMIFNRYCKMCGEICFDDGYCFDCHISGDKVEQYCEHCGSFLGENKSCLMCEGYGRCKTCGAFLGEDGFCYDCWAKNNISKIANENGEPIDTIKAREYYGINRDKILTKAKKYHQSPEFKDYIKEYNKIPEVNIKHRLRARVRIALKMYTNEGKIKKSDEYEINYEEIIKHLKPFPEDKHLYHIDHIKPLCSFNFINKDGTQNLKEIKLAFAPNNHQWLLAEENLSKSGKWDINMDEEWYFNIERQEEDYIHSRF